LVEFGEFGACDGFEAAEMGGDGVVAAAGNACEVGGFVGAGFA